MIGLYVEHRLPGPPRWCWEPPELVRDLREEKGFGESECARNSWIAIVTPITEAPSLLDRQAVVAYREEWDKVSDRLDKAQSDEVAADFAADESERQEFEIFQSLAKQLANTPKPGREDG